ncbi:MAG TPA: TatD family hydrolase [Bryobacteraceae bacterium]|nr:TatD family hydrolase [Bryobacteraceae bacterium]
MDFADSHCHLDDQQFDADRPAVIERAREAGLKYILTIGTGNGPPALDCAVRLAEQYSFVFATVGVHPNDAPKVNHKTFRELERLFAHPKVKAVGEIGLDYHWGVPKETQMPVFVRQLEMTADSRLPVVIHTRDAWEDTIAVLRTHWAPTGLPCVMHCFTGSATQAKDCLDLGFSLAFGGVTTFPKAVDVREAARITPLDKLLLETDAPYLAPVPHRGKRNEPAFLVRTGEAIARARGIELQELAKTSTATFEQIFRIDAAI